MKKNLIPLPPNRVRRNYLGGMILDQLSGQPDPKDGNRPEEWIASTSEACNPGLKDIPNEGLAHITENNQSISLKDLFAEEPEFYLGKEHYNKLGNNLGFLAKLLDSSMRLHLQAHPTAEYAQKHLNSQWGKLETYYILDVRPDCEGYIWLGFQHAPTQEEWNRIVLTQDMAAMHKCFEKVPVKKGEVWVIPGGIPHAIGEGVLVLEVMEPTDLVVRCEFERQGIVVPPDARFMGIDPEQALEIFDLEQNSIEEIHNKCAVTPIMLESTNNSTIELLIGKEQTNCFTIRRLKTTATYTLTKENLIYIGIVAKGSGTVTVENEKINVEVGSTFLVSANANNIEITSRDSAELEILFCSPGN